MKPIDVLGDSDDSKNRCEFCRPIPREPVSYCCLNGNYGALFFKFTYGGFNEKCTKEDWSKCPLNKE